GVVIALPILLIFFLLFVSADQAFNELIGKIDINFSSKHLGTFILFYIVYSFVLGGLLIKKLNLIVIEQNYSRTVEKGIPLIISSTVISLIALLFLTFVGVQFYYLFGDHDKVVDLGLTYSEYARKGFWELQAISIFSFMIIYVLQRFTVVKGKRAKLLVNVLLSLFILQVLIVLYSAHKRMSLYEDGYGFTELRFYPHVFMLYEAILFGYLLISLYVERIFKHFSVFSFSLGLVFVIALNFLNPNQYIARKNIDRYEDGKTLDVKYLIELSPDAYIELKDVDFEVYDLYRCELLTKREGIERENDNWMEYNIAGQHTIDVVNELTEDLSTEQCKGYVEGKLYDLFEGYSAELEDGDFEGALAYWNYGAEDVSLLSSIPESFNVEEYGYDDEIYDTYFKYDGWFDEDVVQLEDFMFITDFDDYTGQSVELKYSNNYGTYCKNDYIALDIINGEIVIDRSSSLPLRYSAEEERNSYTTEGNMISELRRLADSSSSSCSYFMR
ncbi:DUF4173 domain-containing protein, partial [Candidatus Dojkabacteria bacterium]|nr:DUF4173 domain-containing protein [Candidatus Dojkabacteria bacterium]